MFLKNKTPQEEKNNIKNAKISILFFILLIGANVYCMVRLPAEGGICNIQIVVLSFLLDNIYGSLVFLHNILHQNALLVCLKK